MRKLIKIIFVLLICLSVKTVYAENYKLKELIPYEIKTTIHTDNFSYKELYFDKEAVHFNSIKNLTNEDLPISISVGLFNKKGINIGTINHCDLSLKGKEEMSYTIKFEKKYLGKEYDIKDIKYIAILGDNMNCRTSGSTDFVGQSVDKLGIAHNNQFDSSVELLFNILYVIGGALVILVIYKLIFTKSYNNMDGNVVRDAYDDINRELAKEREEYARTHVEVKEEKLNKPAEILEQEENAKKEDKSGTDLHNLYK